MSRRNNKENKDTKEVKVEYEEATPVRTRSIKDGSAFSVPERYLDRNKFYYKFARISNFGLKYEELGFVKATYADFPEGYFRSSGDGEQLMLIKQPLKYRALDLASLKDINSAKLSKVAKKSTGSEDDFAKKTNQSIETTDVILSE